MSTTFDFKATVTDVSIRSEQEYFGYLDSDNFDVEFTRNTAFVSYMLEIEAREWGIKHMHIEIQKILCPVEWYVSNADECTPEEINKIISYGGVREANGDMSGKFLIDTTKPDSKGRTWTIDQSDLKIKHGGNLSISEISINLREASIEVR